MTKVHCSVPERYVNPLFEVFDGGDFILSSYHDIEESDTQMQVYLSDPAQAGEAARRLKDALALVGSAAKVETSEVPDEDWKLAYRRHFKIEPIGRRLVTVPTWELESFKASGEFADRIPLVLDPGMAFGTGKHETTRACLEYIDEKACGVKCLRRDEENGARAIQTLKPSNPQILSFLDMGCGSGILSIAAAKLGFSPVAGFDIDEDAVNASRENAALNGVSVDYRLFALGKGAVTLDESIEAARGVYPDLALQGRDVGSGDAPFAPADFVVANILGPLLIAFADEIAGYAKKTLIVSGILTELYPEVLAAFQSRGFREISRKTIGEWTTGCLCRI
ncbi:MAG: 50S ribosomal protein L11 methyltransferase [Kiritimatiellae bacterium]|nr:50S ribosomal protein L11 methyltransferase [Kiritimatiellia bacterium]